MVITEQIKEKLRAVPDGCVLTLKDFNVDSQYEIALVKALSRLVVQGELQKVSKGRYYKPRRTMFGILKPAETEIAKDFLEKGGKILGYITGPAAFSSMGLTTQITSSIMIGSNKYRRPLKRSEYRILFVLQQNPITEENIPLLRILDAIRLLREIPGTTPDECVERIGKIIVELSVKEQQQLCLLAEKYAPYVRALLGAILEMIGVDSLGLKLSLNGVTTYKLPVSETVLPTKLNWNIKLLTNEEL
jgi:hypothetical protein